MPNAVSSASGIALTSTANRSASIRATGRRFADQRDQPLAGHPQQPLAAVVPEGVVDLGQHVQLDQQDRAAPARR